MVPPPFGRQNATRLVPGLLPQDSNGLPDFGRLLLRSANRHQSTARRLSAAKSASHLRTPLHPRLSMFGLETRRGATLARSLSTCRPLREHLPSSSIAPVRLIRLRRLQDWVCLAVPDSEESRRKNRAVSPFPAFRQDHLTTPGRQILK